MKPHFCLIILTTVVSHALGSEFHTFSQRPRDEIFSSGLATDGNIAFGHNNGRETLPIWTTESGFELLAAPDSVDEQFPRARAASSGTLLVSRVVDSGGDGKCDSYLWSADSGYEMLPDYPGPGCASARGLSLDASWVVGTTHDRSNETSAWTLWTWSEQTEYQTLPVSYEESGNPRLIADDGTIVFAKSIYHPETGLHSPSELLDGEIMQLYGASADGSKIVGRVNSNLPGVRYEPGIWDVIQNTITPLGILSDYPHHYSVTGRAISADGKVVVGQSHAPDPDTDPRAVVWDHANGLRELEVVLREEYGIGVHRWGLASARGISADRRTILGHSWDRPTPSDLDVEMWVARLDWPLGSIRSDFDLDDTLDGDDADLLVDAMLASSDDPLWDLNGDQRLDHADLHDLLSRAERINGDANFDGEVDFADFLALSAQFAQPATWSQGDFDASGRADFADFLILSANFAPAAATPASVPEPAAAAMALGGLMLACHGRRCSRRAG